MIVGEESLKLILMIIQDILIKGMVVSNHKN